MSVAADQVPAPSSTIGGGLSRNGQRGARSVSTRSRYALPRGAIGRRWSGAEVRRLFDSRAGVAIGRLACSEFRHWPKIPASSIPYSAGPCGIQNLHVGSNRPTGTTTSVFSQCCGRPPPEFARAWLLDRAVCPPRACRWSFLNVVIYRTPGNESVVSPRSACPACGAPIREKDNIPVALMASPEGSLSRLQGAHLGSLSLVELRCAALFAGTAARFGFRWDLPAFLALFAGLLALSCIDIELLTCPKKSSTP